MIYRHSSLVSSAVRAHDNLLHDIKPYFSLHIRRGDKVASASKEAEAIDISMYVKQIKITHSNIDNIFIATDDYRVIEDFKKICPTHWNVVTFCKSNATGHIRRQFINESNAVKKQLMIDLLIDIHFLIKAQFFIGTYSSNIGRLIALAKGSDKCYSLYIEKWHPF